MSALLQEIKQGKSKGYDNWKAKYLQGTGNDAVLVVPSNPYNRPASQIAFEQILKDLKLTPNYFTYAKGGRLERVARFQIGGNAPLKNVINPVTTYTGTSDEGGDGGEDNTNGSQPEGFKNNLWGRLNGIFNGPLPYRFARLFVQNNANERMTDLMK
jgi:hypothetical protein